MSGLLSLLSTSSESLLPVSLVLSLLVSLSSDSLLESSLSSVLLLPVSLVVLSVSLLVSELSFVSDVVLESSESDDVLLSDDMDGFDKSNS